MKKYTKEKGEKNLNKNEIFNDEKKILIFKLFSCAL